MTQTENHQPTTIDVLIHLNITMSTDDVETAENMAWMYAHQHGITDDVVMLEAT